MNSKLEGVLTCVALILITIALCEATLALGIYLWRML